MSREDWVPRREQDLVDLLEKWRKAFEDAAKITAFSWDQADCQEGLSKITAFLDCRLAYQSDDSSQRLLAKTKAKKDAIGFLRDFAKSGIRFNKKIPDEEKLNLGLRPTDGTQTSHPKPSSQPDTVVENTINHFEHRVRALSRGRNDNSKPEDAYGVRYAWQIGGEKPASGADLPKTQFSRRTAFIVTHTEEDKAKTAYYATCYENSKGQIGPWSVIAEAVIA
jgi:hypothetical protein